MENFQRPKLTFAIKLTQSLGWPVETIVLLAFELFILFYYTQVLGLSGTLTGLALFIAMCLDGLADPFIGIISDNLRNARWGRRHTFMFLAPLPLGVFFALVYMPPVTLHGLALAGWLAVMAAGARLACGVFIIPYSTQMAEMTRDSEVRAGLSIYKTVAQTIFQFLMLWGSYKFFFAASPGFANGQQNAANYAPFGLVWGAILVIITGISSAGTYRYMRRIEAMTPLGPPKRMSIWSFFASWKAAVAGNPNVRVVFLGAIAMITASGMARGLTSHMGVYFWRLTPSQIGAWQNATIPGIFVGMFAARYLVKRFDTKPQILMAMVLIYLSYIIPPALRLMGLLPPDGNGLVFDLLIGMSLVNGLGFGVVSMIAGLMSAATADEEELLLGAPAQGLLFGFVFLATKLGSGFGKLFAGVSLDLIKFPAGAVTAPIPAIALQHLALMVIFGVLIFGSISLLIWSQFTISKRRHDHITSALASRELPPMVSEAPDLINL